MKVQNIVRMTVATVGFAAAMLFVSAAPAQEITNSEWPDSSTQTVQTASTTDATVAAPAAATTAANVSDANVAASQTVTTQEASVAAATVPNGMLTSLMILFVGGGTLYSLTGLRRNGRNRYVATQQAAR
jgi:hypothetical protein